MKILLTGATGFVGRNLLSELKEDNNVFCLARNTLNLLNGCTKIQHDMLDPLPLNEMPSKIDTVIHLSYISGTETGTELNDNLNGTKNLLEYAKNSGADRFIYISSGSVYGYNQTPLTEETPPNPKDLYGTMKYFNESIVLTYSGYFNTIILRPFFPYGPGQTNRRIPGLIEQIYNRKTIDIINDGQPRINPIFIDDLVEVIINCCSINDNITMNVSGDDIVSMVELANLIGRILNRAPVFNNIEDVSVSNLIGDNSMLKQLGLAPRDSLPLWAGLQFMVERNND